MRTPNLQKISLDNMRGMHKYSNGEDPDERGFAKMISHDINIVSNFRKLRELHICRASLNGIYPVLFDFPLLRVLCITGHGYRCGHLKFDLEMLEGLPSLEELNCDFISHLTGKVKICEL